LLLFICATFAQQTCENGNCQAAEEKYPKTGKTIEISTCLRAPMDIEEDFTNLIAECDKMPKNLFPINITQSNMRQISTSNSYLMFDSDEISIGKLNILGDVAMILKNGKINVFTAQRGETNFTIPKCKKNKCNIKIDQIDFSAMNDLYFGDKLTISSKSVELISSTTYQSSIHIGLNSQLRAEKVNITGFTVLYCDNGKKNMSEPYIVADEFTIDRPISLQLGHKLNKNYCVPIIKSPSLKKFPKTMQFDIDKEALNLIELIIKKGNITEFSAEGKKTIVTVDDKAETPKGYEKKTYEGDYIEIPFKSGKEVYPVSDLDEELIAVRTVLVPEEKKANETIYLLRILDDMSIKVMVKNPEKYKIIPTISKKGKPHYNLHFNYTDLDIKSSDIFAIEELSKKKEVTFPLIGDEYLSIPPHYFDQKGKYPLKNYEIWDLDGEEYIVFRENTKLNMFSFYTDSHYKLTRVDDQILLCNPPEVKPTVPQTNTTETVKPKEEKKEKATKEEKKEEVTKEEKKEENK